MKFLAFYGTRRFITVLTRSRKLHIKLTPWGIVLLEKLKATPLVKGVTVFLKIYMCLIKHHAMKTYGEVK
jgi:hypothetical protein